MLVAGFRDHGATDGSLEFRAGGCGSSVVQLDHDEEMGPLHGMYGTLDVELKVQRTIQRAEFTAFLSPQESYFSYRGPC